MMFVLQLSAITRIISSCEARSHWTLWWISLVSRGTDNNWPQKQNTDYTKNKCITFTSSSLIKESSVKCVDYFPETEMFPSFSFTRSCIVIVIVCIVTVVGSWLPESLHSPGRRSSFPLISTPGPSSCLTSNSIVSSCVRRKWNAPALIIIAPC